MQRLRTQKTLAPKSAIPNIGATEVIAVIANVTEMAAEIGKGRGIEIKIADVAIEAKTGVRERRTRMAMKL